MEFKIIDDFLSKEELEELDKRDFSEDIREAEKNGNIVVAEGNWDETVKAVKAKKVTVKKVEKETEKSIFDEPQQETVKQTLPIIPKEPMSAQQHQGLQPQE